MAPPQHILFHFMFAVMTWPSVFCRPGADQWNAASKKDQNALSPFSLPLTPQLALPQAAFCRSSTGGQPGRSGWAESSLHKVSDRRPHGLLRLPHSRQSSWSLRNDSSRGFLFSPGGDGWQTDLPVAFLCPKRAAGALPKAKRADEVLSPSLRLRASAEQPAGSNT